MINRADLEKEIVEQARAQDAVRQELNEFAATVLEVWRSHSPVDEGRYAASVKVIKDITVNGMPGKRVGATDFKAHWIEFGTGNPGPTEAFAPRAKTVSFFGGDETPAAE